MMRHRPKVPRCARDDNFGVIAAVRWLEAWMKKIVSSRAKRGTFTLALLLAVLAFPALAVEPSEMLPDPALEARARDIGRSLRCVVCQNQSIDDSVAEVAHDMRLVVRERLTAGDSDAQVFDYMVARYGDYVLLKPPFKTATAILWLGAPVVLLLAAGLLYKAGRRRAQRLAAVRSTPLSDEERRRLSALLASDRTHGER